MSSAGADEPDWRAHLEPLVAEGVLSAAQADRVARHLADAPPPAQEASATVASAARPGARAGRRALVETTGYLGAALLAAAVWLLGDAVWLALPEAARAGLLAVVGVGLGAGGHALRARTAYAAGERLTAALWALAAAALGGASAVGVAAADGPGDWQALAGGATAAVAGGWWWRQRRAGLQLVVLFVAGAVTLSGAFAAADLAPGALTAAVVTAVGATWLALTVAGVLVPTSPAALLGGLATALGPQLTVIDHPMGGPAALLLVAAALLALGARRVWTPLLVVGTLAATAAVLQLVDALLPGELGTVVALLAAGAALLAGSLATARASRGRGASELGEAQPHQSDAPSSGARPSD